MAGNVSKNAHREGSKVLLSKWGGVIKMKSVFENGKLTNQSVGLVPKEQVEALLG